MVTVQKLVLLGLYFRHGGLYFGSENNKSGAKHVAKADSRPGPRTKVNAMFKEDISEKKIKRPDPLILRGAR